MLRNKADFRKIIFSDLRKIFILIDNSLNMVQNIKWNKIKMERSWMIKIKLEKKSNNKIIFKLKISDEYRNEIIFKRALMEAKIIKNSRYNYEVPLRFFLPIINNVNKEEIVFDRYSIDSYFEFSDCYDEKYYVSLVATPQFMKRWRDEECPDIYKVIINKEDKEVIKQIAFKKPAMKIKR